MAYIKTIQEEEAEGLVREVYTTARDTFGYVPNHAKLFSLRPKVYQAWNELSSSIRSHMRLRRYELITFASALELNCTYCALAHAAVLRKNFFSAKEIIAIVQDYRSAGLAVEEVALMTLAQKIIQHAGDVNEADIEELRGFGLKDEEILDVVLTITARSFFSKTLEALDAIPDDKYLELEPELIQALAKGRPFPYPQ